MPLWMQLLIGGGILSNPADGEGGDLGGGSEEPAPTPTVDPKEGGEEQPAEKTQPKEPASQLTDKEAALLKDVMKQKEAAKQAKAELAAIRESIGDLDLDEVREIISQKKAAETKALEDKGEYERVKQRMAEEHKSEIAKLQAKIDELQNLKGASDQRVNDLTVGSQFTQSEFVTGELVLPPAKARALYGNYFEIEDGKVIGYDKPRGEANRTAIVDSYGQPLGFDDAMRKIIEADPEKDHLIKSKVKPGAGSISTPKGQKVQVPAKPLTGQEKIQAGLAGLLGKNPK